MNISGVPISPINGVIKLQQFVELVILKNYFWNRLDEGNKGRP